MGTVPSAVISVVVERPYRQTYAYLSDPRNLVRWAKGLVTSVEKKNNRWEAVTRFGECEIRFCDFNNLGVVDHKLVFPDGSEYECPMRCHRNGDGTQIVFTLIQPPSVGHSTLQDGIAVVTRDLNALKDLLEGS